MNRLLAAVVCAFALSSAACARHEAHGYILAGEPAAGITCAYPGAGGTYVAPISEIIVCSLPVDPAKATAMRQTWTTILPPGMHLQEHRGILSVERGTDDLALALVLAGLGVVKPANVESTERYANLMRAQSEAQRAHLGIWAAVDSVDAVKK